MDNINGAYKPPREHLNQLPYYGQRSGNVRCATKVFQGKMTPAAARDCKLKPSDFKKKHFKYLKTHCDSPTLKSLHGLTNSTNIKTITLQTVTNSTLKLPANKKKYFKKHSTHKGTPLQLQLSRKFFPVLTKKPRCNLKQLVIALVTKAIQVAWDLWAHINGIKCNNSNKQIVTGKIPRNQYSSY
jgi:hypothetical protein